MPLPERYNTGYNVGVGEPWSRWEILLVRRASRLTRQLANTGGFIEADETIEAAVGREVAKKLQAECGVLGIRSRYNPDTGNSIYVVLLMRPSPRSPPDMMEVDRAGYFSEEITRASAADQRRVARSGPWRRSSALAPGERAAGAYMHLFIGWVRSDGDWSGMGELAARPSAPYGSAWRAAAWAVNSMTWDSGGCDAVSGVSSSKRSCQGDKPSATPMILGVTPNRQTSWRSLPLTDPRPAGRHRKLPVDGAIAIGWLSCHSSTWAMSPNVAATKLRDGSRTLVECRIAHLIAEASPIFTQRPDIRDKLASCSSTWP
jgi:ADP-ribose pyrophosphatase YjhB (NUDIX family)